MEKKISEEKIFELTINAGANDCKNLKDVFEIITKEDFYKRKIEIEKESEFLLTLQVNGTSYILS